MMTIKRGKFLRENPALPPQQMWLALQRGQYDGRRVQLFVYSRTLTSRFRNICTTSPWTLVGIPLVEAAELSVAPCPNNTAHLRRPVVFGRRFISSAKEVAT